MIERNGFDVEFFLPVENDEELGSVIELVGRSRTEKGIFAYHFELGTQENNKILCKAFVSIYGFNKDTYVDKLKDVLGEYLSRSDVKDSLIDFYYFGKKSEIQKGFTNNSALSRYLDAKYKLEKEVTFVVCKEP